MDFNLIKILSDPQLILDFCLKDPGPEEVFKGYRYTFKKIGNYIFTNAHRAPKGSVVVRFCNDKYSNYPLSDVLALPWHNPYGPAYVSYCAKSAVKVEDTDYYINGSIRSHDNWLEEPLVKSVRMELELLKVLSEVLSE